MKKVAIAGEKQAALVDAPDPEARAEFVVVKIHAAPMCAEYTAFHDGKSPAAFVHP